MPWTPRISSSRSHRPLTSSALTRRPWKPGTTEERSPASGRHRRIALAPADGPASTTVARSKPQSLPGRPMNNAGFDSAEAIAGNGTSPPSSAAQPAELLGIRRNSAASAADKLVARDTPRRPIREHVQPGNTKQRASRPAGSRSGEIREQSRVASHEHPNSARTSTHRTALCTTGVRSAAQCSNSAGARRVLLRGMRKNPSQRAARIN